MAGLWLDEEGGGAKELLQDGECKEGNQEERVGTRLRKPRVKSNLIKGEPMVKFGLTQKHPR